MTEAIFDDARQRPELFVWEGSIGRQQLVGLLAEHGWSLPHDLVSFWERTGGGEIFEGEYLLGPCADMSLGDNLFSYNEELRDRGLSDDYVVFHTGMTVSAVRLADGCYLELDVNDFHERSEFASLDDWYRRSIRMEYAERYGLSTAAPSRG